MTRAEIYKEIREMMGVVPMQFKSLPDSMLETEWELFKKSEAEEGAIPAKYRELMGLAVASAIHCKYCAFFHTEVARLAGATDAEIEEATRVAKFTSGWSAYANGMQFDFNQFKGEVLTACDHMKKQMAKKTGKKTRELVGAAR